MTITEVRKKHAHIKAERFLAEIDSDRKLEKKLTQMERSVNELDRITAITMRSILAGDTDESFRKAVKVYRKTTKDHVRIA